jgi:FkbM family methyltransferase
MRRELLWNPGLAVERLAYEVRQRRRLKRLRGTVAQSLAIAHIESLELLENARELGIRTIYDIGANVGTWTLLAKAVIPESTIEAFEPLTEHCTAFDKNLSAIGGVRLHRVALGPKDGVADLRVTNFSDASSLLPLVAAGQAEFGVQEVEQVRVEMRRLDDYRREHKLLFPDLIKLDVQGYELQVLAGAEDCLRHAKALIVEASFIEYYEGQCLFHDIVGYLVKFGLFLAVLGDHTPAGRMLRQTDVLFLRSRLVPE